MEIIILLLIIFAFSFWNFYFRKDLELQRDGVLFLKGGVIYYNSTYLTVEFPGKRVLKCKRTLGAKDVVNRDFRLKYEDNYFYLYLEFTRYKIELV